MKKIIAVAAIALLAACAKPENMETADTMQMDTAAALPAAAEIAPAVAPAADSAVVVDSAAPAAQVAPVAPASH